MPYITPPPPAPFTHYDLTDLVTAGLLDPIRLEEIRKDIKVDPTLIGLFESFIPALSPSDR